MAIANLTTAQRERLANSLTRAAQDVHRNLQNLPVNYADDVAASLALAKTLLDAAITA